MREELVFIFLSFGCPIELTGGSMFQPPLWIFPIRNCTSTFIPNRIWSFILLLVTALACEHFCLFFLFLYPFSDGAVHLIDQTLQITFSLILIYFSCGIAFFFHEPLLLDSTPLVEKFGLKDISEALSHCVHLDILFIFQNLHFLSFKFF